MCSRKEPGAAGEKARPAQASPPTGPSPRCWDGWRAELGYVHQESEAAPRLRGTSDRHRAFLAICERSRRRTRHALETGEVDTEEEGRTKVWAVVPAWGGIATFGLGMGWAAQAALARSLQPW